MQDSSKKTATGENGGIFGVTLEGPPFNSYLVPLSQSKILHALAIALQLAKQLHVKPIS